MWRTVKRGLLGVLTVVLLLPLAACAQFVCLEPLRNDWAAEWILSQSGLWRRGDPVGYPRLLRKMKIDIEI